MVKGHSEADSPANNFAAPSMRRVKCRESVNRRNVKAEPSHCKIASHARTVVAPMMTAYRVQRARSVRKGMK